MTTRYNALLAAMIGLLSITATASAQSDAQTPPAYPKWGVSFLNFKACTASNHVANVQIKISNFSSLDMQLPEGQYVWSTLAETTAAASQVFSTNLPPFIAKDTDDKVLADGYLGELAHTETTIHGAREDGKVGDWPVLLDEKNMLQVKMALMSVGKYTAISVNYERQFTWVKVDSTTSCTPVTGQN